MRMNTKCLCALQGSATDLQPQEMLISPGIVIKDI